MKILVQLSIAAFFLTIIKVSSQTAPPQPPKTVSITNSSTYSSSSDNHKGNSSSLSVKKTNSVYKFRASYDDKLTIKVGQYLKDNLEHLQFTNTNDSSFWNILKNNEEVFKCKVSEGTVKIYVDRNMTSKKFQHEIEKLGEELKYIINGENPEEGKKQRIKEAEEALIKAKEAYEKAKNN